MDNFVFFSNYASWRPEEIKSIQSQFSKNINQEIPDFSHQNSSGNRHNSLFIRFPKNAEARRWHIGWFWHPLKGTH